MQGYAFDFQGKVFTPEGRADIPDPAAHNAALEAAEIAYWTTAPNTFAAYVAGKDGAVTTWLGTRIGSITASTTYKHNLSRSRLRAVTVLGTNGATYHGRYGSDWSQLVRLRKSKKT